MASEDEEACIKNPTLHKEAFHLLVGNHIGGGAYRQVFHSRIDPLTVVKIEADSGSFANVHEWEVWDQMQYGPLKKWFAPCLSISPCGAVMIQAATTPASKRDLPKKVPGFLTDLKSENWGWIKDKLGERIVCHDYGNILIGQSSKLKKADW